MKNILVTGASGYLGKVLCPMLDAMGWHVQGADIGLYEEGELKEDEDVRTMEVVKSVDLIVHLAAIVGEPACQAFPELARSVNLTGTTNMLREAQKRRVPIVFASTCSVYGAADHVLFEDSGLKPLGIYARDRLVAERMVIDQNGAAIRFGTLFGWSERMRFDLVVNGWTAEALKKKRISVHGGNQWRPFLHVEDAASTIMHVIEHYAHGAARAVQGEVFNAASQNVTIIELANIMRQVIDCEVEIQESVVDARNYRVATNKINELGWEPCMTIRDGIESMVSMIKASEIDHNEPYYSNIEYLKQRFPVKK